MAHWQDRIGGSSSWIKDRSSDVHFKDVALTMSELTRLRIKIVAILATIVIISGVWIGFPRGLWIFVFLFWLIMGIFGIPLSALADHWDRMKARDLIRYAVRDDPH